MSKCKGCGKELQNTDKTALGYTPSLDNKLCERCFKIKNYNFHDNNDRIMSNKEIIEGINKKNAFTLFLCDVLSINEGNVQLYKSINSPKAFVVTKIDILPKNLDIEVFRKNITKVYKLNNVYFSSVKTGDVESKIGKVIEENARIVMAGPTSSGKSSLINKLFGEDLTVSHFKNTTLDFINLRYDGVTIIDAPGFNNPGMEHPLRLNGEIKPRTLNIKAGYEVKIENVRFYADKDLNLTAYLPKSIMVATRKKKEEFNVKKNVKAKSDLVIDNIGFIYFKEGGSIHLNNLDDITFRESLVTSHE